MMKEGKYRAFRNIFIGWVTHSNHGRDKTERFVHWFMEVLIWFLIFIGLSKVSSLHFLNWQTFAISFFITHTLWWGINGNLHVYFLDSFKCVGNAGIHKIVDYISWVSNEMIKTEAVDAVLIYGSFCRSSFHNRSDLDLRIIRRINAPNTVKLFFLSIYARVVSFYIGVPTDLQVVDSMDFLNVQMRKDEHPIVVYCRSGFKVERAGISFKSVLENPSLVLKI